MRGEPRAGLGAAATHQHIPFRHPASVAARSNFQPWPGAREASRDKQPTMCQWIAWRADRSPGRDSKEHPDRWGALPMQFAGFEQPAQVVLLLFPRSPARFYLELAPDVESPRSHSPGRVESIPATDEPAGNLTSIRAPVSAARWQPHNRHFPYKPGRG